MINKIDKICEKGLDYLEHITNKYGIYFVLWSLSFLLVVLLIDIFKTLI